MTVTYSVLVDLIVLEFHSDHVLVFVSTFGLLLVVVSTDGLVLVLFQSSHPLTELVVLLVTTGLVELAVETDHEAHSFALDLEVGSTGLALVVDHETQFGSSAVVVLTSGTFVVVFGSSEDQLSHVVSA